MPAPYLVIRQVIFLAQGQGPLHPFSAIVPTMWSLAVDNDVQSGGRLRHADILATKWVGQLPFVGDVVVTHPLAPSLGARVYVYVRGSQRTRHGEVVVWWFGCGCCVW